MKNAILFTFSLILFPLVIRGQNIGVNTFNPSAKLHIKGQEVLLEPVKDNYEEGAFYQGSNIGDDDWFVTSTDGFNSIRSAKCPFILDEGNQAILEYKFAPAYQKEITVEFYYKYVNDDANTSFTISTYNHSVSPPNTPNSWKQFSFTYASETINDFIHINVEALQSEANPLILIDNLSVRYTDGHALKLEDGSQGEGKILESDALGHTKWIDLRSEIQSNMDESIEDNYQTLSFDHSEVELTISEENTVVVSGLKNPNAQTFRIDGFELIGSPGLSLNLPAANSNTSMFEYTGSDGKFYRGRNPVSSLEGYFSTRWGWYNKAQGLLSSTWGQANNAQGARSTAWGLDNNAIGDQSTSWGNGNVVNNELGTAFGKDNTIFSSSIGGTSWGALNITKGTNGTTWGEGNENDGIKGTIFGTGNEIQTSVQNGTVWGEGNINNAERGTVWGHNNVANGVGSTVFGRYNKANSFNEVSFGGYNLSPSGSANTWVDDDQLFSIGVGSSDTNRKNAMTVRKNGEVSIGEGDYNYTMSINSINNGNTSVYITDEFISGMYINSGYESLLELTSSLDSRISLQGDDDATIFLEGGDDAYININAVDKASASIAGGDFAFINLRGDIQTDISFGFGSGNGLVYDKLEDQFHIGAMYLNASSGGNIGIGESEPAYDLHLDNNDAAKPGSSSWTVSSDARLKKDVEQFVDGLDILSKIEPVWFTYNGVAGIPQTRHVGTIAQELQKVAPYMVGSFINKSEDGTETEYLDVDYGAMDFVLINAVKEQQILIESLQTLVEAQNVLLDEQRSANDELTSKIENQQQQIDAILNQLAERKGSE